MQDQPERPDDEFHFRFTFSRRQLKGGLLLALLLGLGYALKSVETMRLSTYYPAPAGVYRKLITTWNTTLARDGGTVLLAPTVGKVGIGTDSPQWKLQVDGAVGITGGDWPGHMLIWKPNATTGAFNVYTGHNYELRTGNFVRMFISGMTGNVGIGTQSPVYKLDVAGDINVQAGSNIRVGGVPLGGGAAFKRATSTTDFVVVPGVAVWRPIPNLTATLNLQPNQPVTIGFRAHVYSDWAGWLDYLAIDIMVTDPTNKSIRISNTAKRGLWYEGLLNNNFTNMHFTTLYVPAMGGSHKVTAVAFYDVYHNVRSYKLLNSQNPAELWVVQ